MQMMFLSNKNDFNSFWDYLIAIKQDTKFGLVWIIKFPEE
jgi:hypothetical protein